MKKNLFKRPMAGMMIITALLTMAVSSSVVCAADIDARITKKDGGLITGKARWLKASKVYKVLLSNGTEMTVTLDQVGKVEALKPKDLDTAIRMVQAKQYSAAVPALTRIKDEYTMLQWDAEAARWLVEAYVGVKDISKASVVAEEVVKDNPGVLGDPNFFKSYSTVLVETKQFTKLEKIMNDIIATNNDRELLATLQILRGDINFKKGNFKDALLDGYLRNVVFFANVKSLRPEALFKAMKCFKEIGDNAKADKMRKMLIAEFPESEFAAQAKAS